MTNIPQKKSASKSLLGIYTNTASPCVSENDYIYRKYHLQSVARNLLPNQRVSACLRVVAPHKNDVTIHYDKQRQRAHYRNLMRCESVWHCPICASAITERRKLELTSATTHQGYNKIMLTFTLSHKRGDVLQATLDTLQSAYRRFHAGKAYQTMKRDYGIVGAVRALECTHGVNGWHPHIHQLLFLSPDADIDELTDRAKKRWLDCVRKVGGTGSYRRALDVQTADRYISEYIAKWGHNPRDATWVLEDEIAKQPVKKSRKGGYTPFELLAVAGGKDSKAYSQTRAGKLFVEYALTMKGTRQLVWSRGLKDLLGIEEVSDHDVIDGESAELPLLATLSLWDWARVLHYKQRAQLIKIAHEGDRHKVYLFLHELKLRYERENGT